MNRKEWKFYNESNKYEWYNKTRKIQKSLLYNSDSNAKVIHHLRDTEEQRKYNDEHYELWGHNLDGTFEYGKYVVFWTKEQHNKYHRCSEETKSKIRESIKRTWNSPGYRESHSGANSSSFGRHHTDECKKRLSEIKKTFYENHPVSDETRRKISEHHADISGENHPMYGKQSPLKGTIRPKEVRDKISKSKIGYQHTSEAKKKMSDTRKQKYSGESAPWYGRYRSDETRKKISDLARDVSSKYHEYKISGGTMSWCEFQHYFKQARLLELRDEQ